MVKRWNKLAILSFILGIGSVLFEHIRSNYVSSLSYSNYLAENGWIISLILFFIAYGSAILALFDIKRTKEKGKYLAGFIIISPFLIALYFLIAILTFSMDG